MGWDKRFASFMSFCYMQGSGLSSTVIGKSCKTQSVRVGFRGACAVSDVSTKTTLRYNSHRNCILSNT